MSAAAPERFRHEALLYSGWTDFVAGIVRFVREGLDRHEPVLVVESGEKIDMLRTALGDEADKVMFVNMVEVGANPARIIPTWQDFVAGHADATILRGIGEPIWAGRTPEELVECQRHEALLNTAFEAGRPWWLLCPYDAGRLPPEVIAEARRSHEFVSGSLSDDFQSGRLSRPPLDALLPEPKQILSEVRFDRWALSRLREQVLRVAESGGLSVGRLADFVASTNEVATNSVVHGGGGGIARLWHEGDRVVCEIRDQGSLDQPLADRRRPGVEATSSRGLWLANQLCDLVQIRSGPSGTVVRLHANVEPRRRLKVLSDLN
jgi:anti-sigma regulatory factor (Ser/Thr protein kinase)